MSQNEEILWLDKPKEGIKEKEIVYSASSSSVEVVADGKYRGIRYICLNRGIHPCAYVICDPLFLRAHAKKYDTLDCIDVHGGIDYIGHVYKLKGLKNHNSEDVCFGWSYGHAGDWAGYRSDEENQMSGMKKWTIRELVEDCKNAIDQYLEVKRRDEEGFSPDDKVLTKEILKNLGFKSIFNNIPDDDETALHMLGREDGGKWRIFIDLQTPGLSYAYNQSPRRRYEGSILTLEELKKVVDMCRLPVEV